MKHLGIDQLTTHLHKKIEEYNNYTKDMENYDKEPTSPTGPNGQIQILPTPKSAGTLLAITIVLFLFLVLSLACWVYALYLLISRWDRLNTLLKLICILLLLPISPLGIIGWIIIIILIRAQQQQQFPPVEFNFSNYKF
jgi:hypothetical protein